MHLPSPNYAWSSSNTSVAAVDRSAGLLSTSTIGACTVTVTDTRVSRNQQLASVHVLQPSLLRLYITPLQLHTASPSGASNAVTASGAFGSDSAGASHAGGLNCGVQNVKRGGEGEADMGTVYLVSGRQYSAWAEAYAAEMPHRPILITEVGVM